MRDEFSRRFYCVIAYFVGAGPRSDGEMRKDPWYEVRTDYLGMLSAVIVACMIGYSFIYPDAGPEAGASRFAVVRFLETLGPTAIVLFAAAVLMQVSVTFTLVLGAIGGIGYLLYRML